MDAGIGTGEVIYPTPFKALKGEFKPFKPDQPSKLFHHPTFWSYLWTGLLMGVW